MWQWVMPFPHTEHQLPLCQLRLSLHRCQEHDSGAPGEGAGGNGSQEIQRRFCGAQGETWPSALCYKPGQFTFPGLSCGRLCSLLCPIRQIRLYQAEVLGRIKRPDVQRMTGRLFWGFLLIMPCSLATSSHPLSSRSSSWSSALNKNMWSFTPN